MDSYDLCLAWNWEYDHDFVVLLEAACRSRDVSLLQITPDNLADLDSSPASKAAKSEPALIPLDYYPLVIPFIMDLEIALGKVLIYRIFLLHVLQNVRESKAFSVFLCKVRFVDRYFHVRLH